MLPNGSPNRCRNIRRSKSAVSDMHLSNMAINPALFDSIKGRSILLYDDVVKYGNTSEAARNLLLLAGAKAVDVVTVFATGPLIRPVTLTLANEMAQDKFRKGLADSSMYHVVSHSVVEKMELVWPEQPNLKTWHARFGAWIEDRWPAYVPNDIPF